MCKNKIYLLNSFSYISYIASARDLQEDIEEMFPSMDSDVDYQNLHPDISREGVKETRNKMHQRGPS